MNFKVVLTGILAMMISASVAFASTGESTATMPGNLTVAKGTSITVRAADNITSQKSRKNEKVHFKVMNDVMIGNVIIVPADTDVEGIVTKVKKAGPWDRNGELEVAFSEVKAEEGASLPVTGMTQSRGKCPRFLIKYSLLGVLVKGKEAEIKAGKEVTLQVKEDVVLAATP